MNADEAAQVLSVSRRWVMDAAKRDAIPYVKVGRFTRFDEDDLRAWWRARSRGPRPARG